MTAIHDGNGSSNYFDPADQSSSTSEDLPPHPRTSGSTPQGPAAPTSGGPDGTTPGGPAPVTPGGPATPSSDGSDNDVITQTPGGNPDAEEAKAQDSVAAAPIPFDAGASPVPILPPATPQDAQNQLNMSISYDTNTTASLGSMSLSCATDNLNAPAPVDDAPEEEEAKESIYVTPTAGTWRKRKTNMDSGANSSNADADDDITPGIHNSNFIKTKGKKSMAPPLSPTKKSGWIMASNSSANTNNRNNRRRRKSQKDKLVNKSSTLPISLPLDRSG